MKKSEAISVITDAHILIQLQAMDPEVVGEEFAAKIKDVQNYSMDAMPEELPDELRNVFAICGLLAMVAVDALVNAGLIFDPED